MNGQTRRLGYAEPRKKKARSTNRNESRAVSPTATASKSTLASGTVTVSRAAEDGQEAATAKANNHRGLHSALAIAGGSLAAISISGLITYPFHDRSWAAWAWAGIAVTLGPAFMVGLDRLTR